MTNPETPDPETPEAAGGDTTGSHEVASEAVALPDRLSTDPDSPYYDEELLARGVGIRFKGAEKTNIEEYCVSEGWVRVSVGNARDRKGRPLTLKLQGPVEPYLRTADEG